MQEEPTTTPPDPQVSPSPLWQGPADVCAAAAQAAPAQLDLQDAAAVADLFDRAAQANLNEPLRRGATVHLTAPGKVIMTGDLHDHGLNLQRLAKLADLGAHPERHLILHEIIHGPHRINGRDMSVRTLARVAALKVQYPQQVHLLLANHELAQLGGEGITKGGISVVAAFNRGVDFLYGDLADRVRAAMADFIRSLLLAVRCPNRILCTHSLPSPRQLESFDPTILDRVPTEEDLKSGGSAHKLVWGRDHSQEVAQKLGAAWDVGLFVMGHQPAEMGFEMFGPTMLVLASDHNHGVALPIDLSRSYDMDKLIAQIIPLNSVVV